MRSVLVSLCAVLVFAAAAVEETPRSPVYGYHLREGIPKASAIKAREQRQLEQERIVGGSVTNIAEVPYQAGLVIQILFIFSSVCGASLISPTRLITAAHCKTDGTVSAQHFTVVLGSNTLFTGGQRLSVPTNNVDMHPQWNPNTAANDIAVIKLPSSVQLSNTIQPISLPSGSDLHNDFVGEIALASGFGLTSDGGSISNNQVVSSVELPVIPDWECTSVYGAFFHDTNVCVSGEGGKSTCSGDSGGPLAVLRPGGRVLIGVTSFGHVTGCEKDHPAGFARVTSFLDFINST